VFGITQNSIFKVDVMWNLIPDAEYDHVEPCFDHERPDTIMRRIEMTIWSSVWWWEG